MENEAIRNINEKCRPCVEDMQNHSGYYWLKRAKKLWDAINHGKGRFGKLSLEVRKKMLIDIEINSIGYSPTLEDDKSKFTERFKEIFGKEYKLLR